MSISYRLATAGAPECTDRAPILGLLLHHLWQYQKNDRAALAAAFRMDRGPVIANVMPSSPAALAGLRAGDVVTAIGNHAAPPSPALDRPFDQRLSQDYSDAIETALNAPDGDGDVVVNVMRGDRTLAIEFRPLEGCASSFHLARSPQRNAFADGRHVFLTSAIADIATTDDALAFVLAHEMAHNILHHADRLHAAKVGRGPFRALGSGGHLIRETEREADLLGTDLMLDAGYDPIAGAAVLHLVDRGPLRIAIFGDHEGTAHRIATIRQHVAERADEGRRNSADTRP